MSINNSKNTTKFVLKTKKHKELQDLVPNFYVNKIDGHKVWTVEKMIIIMIVIDKIEPKISGNLRFWIFSVNQPQKG